MVRLLEKSEKMNIRELYQHCFSEDGQKYMDYYFRFRLPYNDIVVKEEDGKIVSALHLIPKTIVVGMQKRDVHYLYAVGTLQEYRQRGYIKSLFQFTLNHMYQNKEPFAYLIPFGEKNAEIYKKMGFGFVMDKQGIKPEFKRKKAAHSLIVRKAEHSDFIRLSIFAQKAMENKKYISLAKTVDYFKSIEELIEVEGGQIEIYVENKVIVGYRIWVEDEILEEVLNPQIQILSQKDDSAKPYVMARLVHIKETLKLFHVQDFTPVKIRITDPMVKENNGVFILSSEKGRLNLRKAKEKDKNFIRIDIGELTQYVFGYKQVEGLPVISEQNRFFINDYV